MPRCKHRLVCVVVVAAAWYMSFATTRAENPFSGPQPGETLSPFSTVGVLGIDAGQPIDFIAEASGKPIVLIFVHDATRPSVGFTRTLSAYTKTRVKDGLVTGIVWLDSDATAAENAVKRMQHALTPGVRLGISPDGQEGPGSYGLNRDVMLTILVGKENKVTANFALVQPSLQADLPKVLQAIVDVIGGPLPKLSELPGVETSARMSAQGQPDPQLRVLLRPMIQRDATPEQVAKAAAEVEAYAAKNDAAAEQIGRIANTIVSSDKLENYGTKPAQDILKRWAKTYAPKDAVPAPDKPAPDKPAPGETQ